MNLKTKTQIMLLEAGITQTQIAEATGITIHTVCRTLRGKSHNQVVQEYIAAILDLRPESLWGSSYAPNYRKRRKQLKSNTDLGL